MHGRIFPGWLSTNDYAARNWMPSPHPSRNRRGQLTKPA